jgi:hypothetical protein
MAGGVIAALAWLSIAMGPSVVSPYPLMVVLPAFTIGLAAPLVPALLFWLWTIPLFRGDGRIPRRSAVALGLLTVLTPVLLLVSWEDGLEYQGGAHAAGMALLNAASLAMAWHLLIRGWRAPSVVASLRFHMLLFGWLAWCAFPVLGELP